MKKWMSAFLFAGSVWSVSALAAGTCRSSSPFANNNCSFWQNQQACETMGQGYCYWDVPADEGSCVYIGDSPGGAWNSNCGFWKDPNSCQTMGRGQCDWE